MTEQEWLTSTDPLAMLRLAAGKVSLCCGCIWCKNSDGTLSLGAGQHCCVKCDNDVPRQGYRAITSDRKLRLFAQVLSWPIIPEETGEGYPSLPYDYLLGFLQGPNPKQAALLRCNVGNPFRPLPDLGFLTWRCSGGCSFGSTSRLLDNIPEFCNKPSCGGRVEVDHSKVVSWHTPLVVSIAQSAYDARDWDALPILADAMDDAGCPAEVDCPECGGKGEIYVSLADGGIWLRSYEGVSELPVYGSGYKQCQACKETGRIPNPILTHLRGPGPHARGCHVIDAILGKE